MKEYGLGETQTQAVGSNKSINESLGKFALTIISLATAVLIFGMIRDNQQVMLAFICGFGFFSAFGGFVILSLSGQLSEIINHYQKEITTRQYNDMQFELYEIEAKQRLTLAKHRRLAAERTLPPEVAKPNFVPARPDADQQLKIATYAFVTDLFEDGHPNPSKILDADSKRPGQIQKKKPEKEVLEYLLALEMVYLSDDRMLFFNTEQYPTLRETHQAIQHNLPARRAHEERLT